MIKVFGLVLFTSIAVLFIVFGVVQNEPVGWQMGGFLLFVIIVITILVKLLPKQLDSAESGEKGIEVLRHTAKVALRNRGE